MFRVNPVDVNPTACLRSGCIASRSAHAPKAGSRLYRVSYRPERGNFSTCDRHPDR